MQRAISYSLMLVCAAQAALADGGTVQFRKQAGPYDITVFSTPQPVRVGMADLSVMVQRSGSHTSVLDAEVRVHLTKSTSGDVTRLTAPATHARATNKMLYSARLKVPSEGVWRLEVEVSRSGELATVAGDLTVSPPEPPIATYWPYLALAPFLALCFVFNRWLKRRARGATGPVVNR